MSGIKERINEIMQENKNLKKKLIYINDVLCRVIEDIERMEAIEKEDYSNGYEDGLSDGWECARKIICFNENGGIGTNNLVDVFGTFLHYEIFRDFSASEALEKIKNYKEKQKQIRVGDEVTLKSDGTKAVITNTCDKGWWKVIDENGYTNIWNVSHFEKTGRHFNEIKTLMEKMRENK